MYIKISGINWQNYYLHLIKRIKRNEGKWLHDYNITSQPSYTMSSCSYIIGNFLFLLLTLSAKKRICSIIIFGVYPQWEIYNHSESLVIFLRQVQELCYLLGRVLSLFRDRILSHKIYHIALLPRERVLSLFRDRILSHKIYNQ